MEFGSSVLADIWVIETTADKATFDAKCRLLADKFVQVEAELGEGPWFSGDRFSLVDAVFAPVFRYFDVFDRIVDLGVFSGLSRVPRWRMALSQRPSVKGAVVADYEAKLEVFLRRRDSHLATLMPGTLATAA
jgi:glutathione S-transferase